MFSDYPDNEVKASWLSAWSFMLSIVGILIIPICLALIFIMEETALLPSYFDSLSNEEFGYYLMSIILSVFGCSLISLFIGLMSLLAKNKRMLLTGIGLFLSTMMIIATSLLMIFKIINTGSFF